MSEFVYVYVDTQTSVVRYVASIDDLPQSVRDQNTYLIVRGSELSNVIYDTLQNTLRLKTEEETLAERKQRMLRDIEEHTRVYIETYYPDLKQRSDLVDQLTNGSLLLLTRSDYTSEYIYRQSAQAVFLIMDQNVPLSEVLLMYPENERLRWEQIIKAAVRQGFLYRVKWEFWNLRDAIYNATSHIELDAIVTDFQTKMPPGF